MSSAGATRQRRQATDGTAAVRRAWAPAVAGLVAAGLVLRMAWQAGGYFPASHLEAGAVALGVCGVLLLVTRRVPDLSTQALLVLLGLTGLAAWTGLSSLWSPAPSRAVEAMQLDMVYLGLVGLGVLAVGSGRYARHVVTGVLVTVGIICLAGLVSRLQPDLIDGSENAAYRLAYPLTYWNSLGALAAAGAVLAVGLAADPRTAWPWRAGCAGLAVALMTTMYLTLSRGAWLALLVGLLVLVLLGAHRGWLLLTLLIVVPLSALAIGRVAGYPALVEDPGAAGGQEAAGDAFTPQLAVIVLIAVAAQGAVAAAGAAAAAPRLAERAARPVAFGLAGAAALVLIVGYAWKSADAEGVAARNVISAENWFDRQWDDFMRPSAIGRTTASRLKTAQGSRSDLYRVALDRFGASPLVGDGAGSFRIRWMEARTVDEEVENAHSLELEVLGETGLIGAALLLSVLGSLGFAAVRSRVRPGALPRSQVAAVAGACAVWAAHSAVDWDWQQPAATAPLLVLAVTLLPYGRRRRRRRGQGARRAAGQSA